MKILNKSLKIAFFNPGLDERGSCIALFDYAYYNQTLLHNKSIIVLPSQTRSVNHQAIVHKFLNHFPLYYFDNMNDLEDTLKKEGCNALYAIKYGTLDGIILNSIPTLVHCVFDLSQPHGLVYAAVSQNLAKKFNKTEFVPHMIGLKVEKGDMRRDLNIPQDAMVYSRMGGLDTFNISFVHQAIRDILNKKDNVWFTFVGTPCFVTHSRVIYINKIINPSEKSRFINTCNAMIHGSTLGETFGIAIGEYSIHNKPVITYSGPVMNDAYRDILGDKAYYYKNKEELDLIFEKEEFRGDKNEYRYIYKDYNPERVMGIFQDVFLSKI